MLIPISAGINALICNFIDLVISLDTITRISSAHTCPYGNGLLLRFFKCDLLHRTNTVAFDEATAVILIVDNGRAKGPLI